MKQVSFQKFGLVHLSLAWMLTGTGLGLRGQVLPSQSLHIHTEGLGYAMPQYYRVEVMLKGSGEDYQAAYAAAQKKIDAFRKEMNQGTTTSFSVESGLPMVWGSRGVRQTGTLPEVMLSFYFPISKDEIHAKLIQLASMPEITILKVEPTTDLSNAEQQALQQAVQKAQQQLAALGVQGSGSGSMELANMISKGCTHRFYDPIWSLNEAQLLPEDRPLRMEETSEVPGLPGMITMRCQVETVWKPAGSK